MSAVPPIIFKENYHLLFDLYNQKVECYNRFFRLNQVTFFAASVGAHSCFEDDLALQTLLSHQSLADHTIDYVLSRINKGKRPAFNSYEQLRNNYSSIPSLNYYLFLGDIQNFSLTFFPNVIPSVNKIFMDYLLSKEIVKTFGTYSKRFVIFKDWRVSDQDRSVIRRAIGLDNSKIHRKHEDDQQYLLKTIDSLCDRLVKLESALETQQKEGINGYLLSWH